MLRMAQAICSQVVRSVENHPEFIVYSQLRCRRVPTSGHSCSAHRLLVALCSGDHVQLPGQAEVSCLQVDPCALPNLWRSCICLLVLGPYPLGGGGLLLTVQESFLVVSGMEPVSSVSCSLVPHRGPRRASGFESSTGHLPTAGPGDSMVWAHEARILQAEQGAVSRSYKQLQSSRGSEVRPDS